MLQGSSFEGLSLPTSSLVALIRAGFETSSDLDNVTAEALSEELHLPVDTCEEIISATQKTKPVASTSKSQTKTVSAILSHTQKLYSICPPADVLLDGGLRGGRILEISGPPGSPKERMMISTIKHAMTLGDNILFLDMMNMTTPILLLKELEASKLPIDTIEYGKCHSSVEFMAFMHRLPDYLDAHPKVRKIAHRRMLVQSFSMTLNTRLSLTSRSNLLDRVKQTLTKLCASKQITVLITSQLSNKIVREVDSLGSSEGGTQAVMQPSLGPSYLPNGRSYRLVLIPNSRTSGTIRLLSSPSHSEGKSAPYAEEPYVIVDGHVQSQK